MISTGQPSTEYRHRADGNFEDAEYFAFLGRIQVRFLANVGVERASLFTTDATTLFEEYLDALPSDQRQYHTCHACRLFIERFGGLVVIEETGLTRSAVWHEEDAPALYRPAVRAMIHLVKRAKVTGVFLSTEKVWGQPSTGTWRHPAVTPPQEMVFKRALLSAGQAMAAKREDYVTVKRALSEFSADVVRQALALLKSEALYRNEKVLGPAQWLADLHTAAAAAARGLRDNVVWRAVAKAPEGFCHPRTSMIGTLLEDIAGGMDFEDVSRRFASKMNPHQYQRPQAAPSAGNIAQAEKVIAELGAAGALDRRFARIDEIEKLWSPAPPKSEPNGNGVFGHLKPKGVATAPGMRVPPSVMTWEKFARTVLPEATSIELLVPSHGNFAALVTAVNPDAPPILQWDSEEKRNPVSWYVYGHGSSSTNWGLTPNTWWPVTTIAAQPSQWFGDRFPHHGESVIFILQGAVDSNCTSLCLFPETLKAEFRAVRATLEAHSKSRPMRGREEASACGLRMQKGNGREGARIRVQTASGPVMEYQLDRWD